MPKSSKPRKKYRPDPRVKPGFRRLSGLEVVALSSQQRAPESVADKVDTRLHLALQNLIEGKGTSVDWTDLASALNASRILAKDFGIGPEVLDIAQQAFEALQGSGRRHPDGKNIKLEPGEVSVLSELVAYADAQARVATLDQMVEVDKQIRQRLRQRAILTP